MELETISDKNIQELERLTRELLNVIKRAKIQDEKLIDALKDLEAKVGEIRRTRFDESNPQYHGY